MLLCSIAKGSVTISAPLLYSRLLESERYMNGSLFIPAAVTRENEGVICSDLDSVESARYLMMLLLPLLNFPFSSRSTLLLQRLLTCIDGYHFSSTFINYAKVFSSYSLP